MKYGMKYKDHLVSTHVYNANSLWAGENFYLKKDCMAKMNLDRSTRENRQQ